ncbi:hypothetical protein GGI07_001311 [Coemansia sp. Benny D115]|nr:hypothetical protein GGI07_001311 [Coemansia sp. Benny D115]
MSSNDIDRALDDIIDRSGSSRAGGRSGGRSHRRSNGSRRDSPYSRKTEPSGSQRSGTPQHSGIKWKHDLYDGPDKSINDRLGSAPGIGSRLGAAGDSSKPKQPQQQQQAQPGRGMAIAGRSKNTTAYTEMRVVLVKELPRSYTSEQIEKLFSDVGRIDSVRMAIDKNGRFNGMTEITYRQPEDARSALQTFDGETLYSTDISSIRKIHVGFSTPKDGEYIEALKYADSLPQPNEIPVASRLGGIAARTMATMGVLAAAQMQQFAANGGLYANAGNAGRVRSQGQGQGQRQHRSSGHGGRRNNSQLNAQQLDDDLDAYMNEGASQTKH